MKTGAFEIYMNGKLEYSKIETGVMPDFNVLQALFGKYDIKIWEAKN